MVLDFLTVDNFDFTRKIVKNLGEKLVKMFGFCQNWIFVQKLDFSNSVWFLSFRILVQEPDNMGATYPLRSVTCAPSRP